MTENEIIQKIQEYINKTNCPIKDPKQLLHEAAMSVTGHYVSTYHKVITDFHIWYGDTIIRVINNTMRDEEMYQKIQEYIDETDCIIKNPKQLLREYLRYCCFQFTPYEHLAKKFDVWYEKNIKPYR